MGDYYTELTAEDIKLLRDCNDRVVVLKGVGEDVADVDIYNKDRKGRKLPVETLKVACHVTNYEGDNYSDTKDISASAHLYSSSDTITTAAACLRSGDRARFQFIRGNANGYTRTAGLAVDHIELHVSRGKKKLRFLLGYSVSARNTARMTRNAAERQGWGF